MTSPTFVAELSSLATEYVKIPTKLTEADRAANPTAATVQGAYTALGAKPGVSDWVAASWDSGIDRYFIRILTGPAGDANPGVGTWWIWLKVTLDPEVVVVNVGELIVV